MTFDPGEGRGGLGPRGNGKCRDESNDRSKSFIAQDPERADAEVFGRKTEMGRRGFLGGAGLAAMGAAVGGAIPFSASMPGGLIPAAFAQRHRCAPPAAPAAPAAKGPKLPSISRARATSSWCSATGRWWLRRPNNCSTTHTTPIDKFFIRNNGHIPEATKEPDTWKITIDGEVNNKLELTLGELKSKFKPVTRRWCWSAAATAVRSSRPRRAATSGPTAAQAAPNGPGVRLADVLKTAGVKSSAVFSGHYGADPHLSGDTKRESLSRGVPIKKLMDENNLIVWAMNGEPLPNIHGFPVRLMIPGWPASVSSKWLTRISIRDREHDGQGMDQFSLSGRDQADHPRRQARPQELQRPGIDAGALDHHQSGQRRQARRPAPRRSSCAALPGPATSRSARSMSRPTSAPAGPAPSLRSPKNKYDWQRWTATVKLPSDGYYEIWTRATDSKGTMQPHIAGNWNPQGYGGNPMHRVAVLVG